MKPVIQTAAVAAALFLLGGSLHAGNGVLIVEKTTGMGPAPSTNQIQIESTRMRAESTGPGGEKRVVMFDGTRQVMTLVDTEKKTYTEVTKDEMERVAGQLADAMARLEGLRASMPPEQRAQMEAMMKGRGGPNLAPMQYRKAGKGEAGKWSCDRYEGYQGEQKTAEICTVEPQALGVTVADFAVMQQFTGFFSRLFPDMSQQMFSLGSAAQGFSGVPVKRTFTAGGRDATSEIVEVTRQSFPDSSYAVPAGYKKESFGPAGRGR